MDSEEMTQALKEELGDGGQAFPDSLNCGMSLRDWFAGQALIGLISCRLETNENNAITNEEFLVAEAYSIANYMIDERNCDHYNHNPLSQMDKRSKEEVLREWKEKKKEKCN